MTDKTTPRPWSYRETTGSVRGRFHIEGPRGGAIASGMNEANAAYIVKAVNSHDAMRKILRSFVESYERDQSWPSSVQIDKARAALAESEEKP